MNKTFGTLFLALLCSLGFTIPSAVTPELPTKTYRAEKILSFEQYKGNPNWQNSIKRRILGAKWVIRTDKSFTYWADGRDDLYPVQGKWRYNSSGGYHTFEASSKSGTGSTGRASINITGKLDTKKGIIEMTFHSSTSNNAIVNNQRFSGSNESSYYVKVAVY